jgi:hypothetical protein
MEIFKMLKVAFEEQIVGRTQVFKWLSKFRKCMNSIEDAKYQESPPTRKKDGTFN